MVTLPEAGVTPPVAVTTIVWFPAIGFPPGVRLTWTDPPKLQRMSSAGSDCALSFGQSSWAETRYQYVSVPGMLGTFMSVYDGVLIEDGVPSKTMLYDAVFGSFPLATAARQTLYLSIMIGAAETFWLT